MSVALKAAPRRFDRTAIYAGRRIGPGPRAMGMDRSVSKLLKEGLLRKPPGRSSSSLLHKGDTGSSRYVDRLTRIRNLA